MSKFLKIDPVPNGQEPWSRAALASSVSPFHLACSATQDASEAQEKAELKQKLGWKDPRGLKCYSKNGTYTDLYVYFDAADKTSVVNVAASKAFKCYGLDGSQFVMNWDKIHGSAIVVKEKPPICRTFSSFGGPSLSSEPSPNFQPKITVEEIVDTLLFFKDKNAAKVAQRRDAQRTVGAAQGFLPPEMMRQMQGMNLGSSSAPSAYPSSSTSKQVYVGTGGIRDEKKLARDQETCHSCGKTRAMAGTLFACSQCVTNGAESPAKYCSRECQAADWKRHKKEDKCRKAKKENH